MLTLSPREERLKAALVKLATRTPRDAEIEIASDEFQHLLLPMPSTEWPPHQRVDVTKALLTEVISEISIPQQRVAASAALRIPAARDDDLNVNRELFEKMLESDKFNQPSRLEAAREILQREVGLRRTQRDKIAWQSVKRASRSPREWWSDAVLKVARGVLREIDKRTNQSAWPLPEPARNPPPFAETLARYVRDNPGFEILNAGSASPLIDWREVLDGSPLSPAHAVAEAMIDRTVMVDGRPLDPDAALKWFKQQSGRLVFLQGDAGDGKTSYVSLLAARSEGTHLFLKCRPGVLTSLPELAAHVSTSSATVAASEPPCLVVVLELAPYLPPTAWQEIGTTFSDRHDGLTVLVTGRPPEIRRLQHYDLPRCERLSLSSLHQGEAEQMTDLICRAHDELLASGWSAESIADRYPNLPKFRGSSRTTQLKVMQPDPRDPLIARVLRAVYGPDSRSVLAGEAVRLDRPSRLAYLAVCLASAIGQSLPGSLLSMIAPDADLDQRALRDPWILNQEGWHQARHSLIAQVVLEETPAGPKALTDILTSWLADAADSSNRALLAGVIGAAPQWPLGGSTAAATGFKDHLLQAVRTVLSTPSLQEVLLLACRGRYADCVEWARISYAAVPHDTKSAAHVPLLEFASALFEQASRTTDRPDPEWLVHPRQAVAIRTDQLAGKLDFDRLVNAIRAIAPLMKRAWASESLYTDVFNWAMAALAMLDPQPLEGPTAAKAASLYSALYKAHNYLRRLHNEGLVSDDKMEGLNLRRGEMMTRLLFVHLPSAKRDVIYGEWRFSVELGYPNMGSLDMYLREFFSGPRSTFVGSEEAAQDLVSEGLEGLAKRPNHTGTLYLLARIGKTWPVARTAAVSHLQSVDPTTMSRVEEAYLAHTRALLADTSDQRAQNLRIAIAAYARESIDRPRFGRVSGDWKLACSELAQTGDSQAAVELKRYRRYESRMR